MQRPTFWRGANRTRGPSARAALLSAVFCLAATALLGPSAAAEAKPRLLILRTESNAIKDADRARLTTALLRAARQYKHVTSVASKIDLVEDMFAFECTEAGVDCLARIGKKYKADKVVYNEVIREGGGALTWSMRVVHVDPENLSASRVAQSTRQPLPGLDKTGPAATKGLLVLIGPVDLPSHEVVRPATVLVRLVGGGVALVYANDQLLGRTSITGLKKQLQPGTYKLRVVRAGYKEWSKTVTLVAGKTDEAIVELALAPVSKGRLPGGGPVATPVTEKWWFWTAIAAGTAVVAVTIWAITRKDDPAATGTVGFSIDSADAHKDPVFIAP